MQPVYHASWLEALEVSEAPVGLDEFIDLLYRFAREDPDGNGKDDTCNLSLTGNYVIFGAFCSFPGFLFMDYGQWYPVEGQLIHADMVAGNKDALALIKQLYERPHRLHLFCRHWPLFANLCHWHIRCVIKEYQPIQGEDADVVFGAYPKGPQGHSGGMKRSPVMVDVDLVYNSDMDEEKLAA
ncbi:MAG: hypothetical protein ACOX8S_08610 [Christensenellales bacterium]